MLTIYPYSERMLRWLHSPKTSPKTPARSALTLDAQVRAMKNEALSRAKTAVSSGREAAAFNNKPGLSHYVRAMHSVCREYGMHLPARSVLDLSGLTIDGFAFTSDDFAIAQTELNKFSTMRGHA